MPRPLMNSRQAAIVARRKFVVPSELMKIL
jgi:hypothetical protein